jgi:hypothetical protein
VQNLDPDFRKDRGERNERQACVENFIGPIWYGIVINYTGTKLIFSNKSFLETDQFVAASIVDFKPSHL